MTLSPTIRLVAGLIVSLMTIAGVGLYTVREIRQLLASPDLEPAQ